MRDTAKLWEVYQAMQGLGDDLPAAIELLTGAARPVLERWFEAEVLKTTLATDAIIGAFASISSPGTAYVLLHHAMGDVDGKEQEQTKPHQRNRQPEGVASTSRGRGRRGFEDTDSLDLLPSFRRRRPTTVVHFHARGIFRRPACGILTPS